MKNWLILGLLLPLAAAAQAPPSNGGYTSVDGITWGPLTTASTTAPYGPVGNAPPPVGLYGYNSATNQWYPCSTTFPCTGSGGGGGGGVTSINTVAGPFTFSFSAGAGSCSSTTCTFTGSSTGGGTVSNFIAASASWPTWLVPTVTTSTTIPTLSVAASSIPNSALANPSTTVNGQTCTLGSTCTVAIGTGTVTSVSVATANGFAGTVANPTTTPAITLTTTVSGVLKSNGTSISAAASSDIIGLWTGTCNSSTVLGGDGVCRTGGGGSSLPSGTTNQLLYYATSGTTVTPLTLGTNLSITSGVLNAAGGGGSGLPCSGTCTAGTMALFGSGGTSVTNSHLDETTTSGVDTFSQPVTVNATSLPSQLLLTYDSIAPTVGSATTAGFAVNSSGQGVLSEAGAAYARICTATNGVCTGGGSVSITSSTGDLTVSPSPLTGTGTIDLNLASANTWTANITAPSFITTGSSPSVFLGQGSPGSLPSNSLGLNAPASVPTSYYFTFPAGPPGSANNALVQCAGTTSATCTFIAPPGSTAAAGGTLVQCSGTSTTNCGYITGSFSTAFVSTTYSDISFNATHSSPNRIGLLASNGGTDVNLYYDVPSLGTHQFRIAGNTYMQAGQTTGTFGGMSFSNTFTLANMAGIVGDSAGTNKNLFLYVPNTGQLTVKMNNTTTFLLDPGTQPTGSCSTVVFEITADGHGTYCNGTTWTSRF